MNKSTIPISEIFYSISGEGASIGQPAIFVRVAGCNFAQEKHACSYCDTKYAQYENQGLKLSNATIEKELSEFPDNISLLIFTGGEPLLYKEQILLLGYSLCTYYDSIEIETNGSINIGMDRIPNMRWSLDIKTPCSSNQEYNKYENLPLLQEQDQVKFVISNKEDYHFAVDVLKKYPCKAQKFFQPCYGELELSELAEWVKKIRGVRLGMQLHKILYGQRRSI